MKIVQTENWSGPEGAHSYRRTEGRFRKDSTKTTLIQERRGVNRPRSQPEPFAKTASSDEPDAPNPKNAPHARLLGEFRQSDFTFTQLKRAGDVAIYQQTKEGQSPAFEVVIIRRREASIAFGKEFPATEYYPHNEDWGTYGSSYCTLEEAERKFRFLIDQERKTAA